LAQHVSELTSRYKAKLSCVTKKKTITY